MDDLKRMDRRTAIKWMLAASSALSLLELRGLSAGTSLHGYGTDPNLMQVYKPGDLWPLTFTKEQHRAVAALCDVMLPADEKSPSASQLKVPDFIDEWISAPYRQQQADRDPMLNGIVWLDGEAVRRFKAPFADLNAPQQHLICDDICSLEKAAPAFLEAAKFFAKFRDLAMGGFYSTPEGMQDIRYLGNIPMAKFEGPPPEVLAHLKLS